jgi:threonine dehydratase
VVVPVGGGGLLAGVGVALRALKPGITIVGVEPESAPCFSAALAAGKPVSVSTFSTLADGLAVSRVGDRTFSIAAGFVDQMVTVSEAEIAMGMREIGIAEEAMVEGAGATALAALFSESLVSLRGKTVVALVSGRNVDAAVHLAATR